MHIPSVLRPAARKLKSLVRPAPIDPAAAAAAQFWDASLQQKGPIYWTAHDVVREYVNECITGVPWLWPLPAFKVGWAYKPLSRGLSIG